MTVRTRVGEALEVAREKRRHVQEKRSALEEFERELREVPARSVTRGVGAAGPGDAPAAVSVPEVPGNVADRCRQVQEAFARTVRQCGLGDDTAEAIGAELGTEFAVALSLGTGAEFSGPTKAAMLSAVADRRGELASMERALGAETRSLRDASEGIGEATGWIADADGTPLSALGFEELRARHEALSGHRGRCGELVRDRQLVLDGQWETTGALDHRALVGNLYPSFLADLPVLATCARLARVCTDCKRAVRAHLVARV